MANGKPSSDLELYKAQLVVAHAEKEKVMKAKSKKKSKENVNPQGDDTKSKCKPPAIA